jgi:hypothetical protein
MYRSAVAIAFLGLLVSAPTTASAQGTVFRGHWVLDSAGAAAVFQPCHSVERWWVDFAASAKGPETSDTTIIFSPSPAGLDSLLQSVLFAVIRGDTSRAGSYGPKGRYARHLLVRADITTDSLRTVGCR